MISDACRGCTKEYVWIVPTSVMGFSAPIQIAEGDVHASYNIRDVVTAVRESAMKGLIFAHSHPSSDPPGPSFGDLKDAIQLKSLLRQWELRLTDIVIG